MTPKAILVTGARAPVALHLARLLQFLGHRVHLACSIPAPMAACSVACHAFHLLPPPRYDLDNDAQTLSRIVLEHAVDQIIPTCEDVSYLGMIKHCIDADIWCPDADDLARVHDKFAFIAVACDLSLSTPDATLITAKSGLSSLASCANDQVFKLQWSRLATDVLIKPTAK